VGGAAGRKGARPGSSILLVLIAGLLIRALLMAQVGYKPDILFWKSWLSYATQYGIANVYSLELPGQTYPPVFLYLLWLLGRLYLWIWPAAVDSAWLTAFVKIPAVAADLVAAVLLARLARSTKGGISPRGAAAMMALNPVWIWLSAYWGQVDILHGGLAAAAWFAALSGAAGASGILLALGVLTKPQGLIILPAAAVLIVRRSGTRALGRAVALGACTAGLICAPFLIAGYGRRLYEIYAGAGGVYPMLSVKAFNPWWIATVLTGGAHAAPLPTDATPLAMGITPHAIGIALFLAATAWIVWRCAGRIDGPRAWRLLTLQWLAFFLLPTQVHERYLAPALVSFAVAAVLDRRTTTLYLLLSLGVFLNLLYVVPGTAVIGRIVRVGTLDGVLVALGFCAIAFLLVRQEVREGGADAR
jgi:hypothetical protein